MRKIYIIISILIVILSISSCAPEISYLNNNEKNPKTSDSFQLSSPTTSPSSKVNEKTTQSEKTKVPVYDPTNLDLYPQEIDAVDIKILNENTLQGFHLVPQDKKHPGIIVCYGGSEGSPNFTEAKRLALEGYETMAIFMFGMENQQKTLTKIPLEQFEDVLNYINNNLGKDEIITLIAGSKGAEYSLNLASKYDEINNLVLTAPSAYNFAALDFSDYASSWTWQGEELAYIDIKQCDYSIFKKALLIPSQTHTELVYREIYDSAIANDPASSEKLIPVENIKAKIMLIVGEDDQMWNSSKMAELIKSQNEENVELYVYEAAGHIFSGDGTLEVGDLLIKMGGTKEANEAAYKQSIEDINNFLDLYHR